MLQILRAAHAEAGPLDVEWFLVDSGSTDGTPEAVEAEFPDVAVIRRPNIGFAAANNIALRGRAAATCCCSTRHGDRRGHARRSRRRDGRASDVGIASADHVLPGRPAACRRSAASLRQPPARRGAEAHASTAALAPAGGRDAARSATTPSSRPTGWRAASCSSAARSSSRSAAWTSASSSSPRRPTGAAACAPRAGTSATSRRCASRTTPAAPRAPDLYAQNSHSKILYARKHFSARGPRRFRAALALRHAVR